LILGDKRWNDKVSDLSQKGIEADQAMGVFLARFEAIDTAGFPEQEGLTRTLQICNYKDPYSDYGRLQDEMLRAIRLVVETGFHFKRWNRAQVVKFFHDHSAIDEVDVQSKTDRYISWPGQALAYKIGH
jgi:hypothetical protein